MGHHSPLKPRRLKHSSATPATASHAAIQRATFERQMSLVDDPDHPGQSIAYCELEQRLRARSYRLALRL